jgi:putative flippase GtrA
MRASGLLGQMIRFGIAGGISTLIYSAVYLPLTIWVFERKHAVYRRALRFRRWR